MLRGALPSSCTVKLDRSRWLDRSRLVKLIARQTRSAHYRHPRNCTICDDAQSASHAYKILRSAPYLILDTEGHKRGTFKRFDDSLSLIQIGTPGASRVFLFDMRTLRTDARRGMLGLLADPRVPKVGWGLPVDFEILYNGYGTRVASMLDLQIVDIHSRVSRGESEEERVARLAWRGMPSDVFIAEGLELQGIHALNRMDAAIAEHSVRGVPLKESFPSSSWDIRPIKRSLSVYAANDIVRISALYEHFRQTGFLKLKHIPRLMLQSALYAGSHILSGFPFCDGKSNGRSNVLPLGVLNMELKELGTFNESMFFFKNQNLRRCKNCHRALTVDCFSSSIIMQKLAAVGDDERPAAIEHLMFTYAN